MIYMHWVPTGQTVNKEYYVEEEIPSEEASTLQIGSVAFPAGQCPNPSLSQTIWPRWTSRQFLTLPILQALLPVTFAYSLSSRKTLEAVVMRELRRWKRLGRRSFHAHTRERTWGLPAAMHLLYTSALQLEEITSKETRVSCVYYQ